MHTSFLKWWLLFVLQAIFLGVFIFFDGINYILKNDRTFLCFIVTFVWLFSSALIGKNIFKQQKSENYLWFAADSCITIGMIGTVLGFILMLGESLVQIDPSNTASMKTAISEMAKGMSTALLTTLTGLFANLFLRSQLELQEKLISDEAQQ
jgi:hypothetical protein